MPLTSGRVTVDTATPVQIDGSSANPEPARKFFETQAELLREQNTVQALETRELVTEPLEFRAATTDDSIGTFAGYAIRYDSPSLPLPFTERVARGALTRTLKSRNDIRMYVNHDDRMVLASTRSKTLRLEDRDDGLYVEADLPDTTYSRDLQELMQRKVVDTMSFGFSTVRDSWSDDGGERTLDEIRLHEVSVVTGVAAYPATSAAVRSWLVPAKRAEVDPAALADAIAKVNAAETLSDDDVDLLMMVIDALRKPSDVSLEDVAELSDTLDVLNSLDTQRNINNDARLRLQLLERHLKLS